MQIRRTFSCVDCSEVSSEIKMFIDRFPHRRAGDDEEKPEKGRKYVKNELGEFC